MLIARICLILGLVVCGMFAPGSSKNTRTMLASPSIDLQLITGVPTIMTSRLDAAPFSVAADVINAVRSGFPTLMKGMSRTEVAELIGSPPQTLSSERWVYDYYDPSSQKIELYVMNFAEGRLTGKSSMLIRSGQ